MLVTGTAPALAENTAGVEPTGEAERAATAKPEALASGTQGKAMREVEPPPQEGGQELKAPLHKGRCKPEVLPPEGERECCMTPQGSPNEGKLEPSWPPQVSSREVTQST